MTIPTLRYKLYRLSNRITLGSLGGRALGTNVCRSLEEGRATPSIAAHVADCRKTAPATVVEYGFPREFPPEFPREAAFDAKFVYRLRDAIVSPSSGLVWFPGGPILQESAGSLPRLFNGRIAETLRRTGPFPETGPVVSFPSFGYYHLLFEALPNVLHALEFVPETKILLARRRPAVIDGILDFLGLSRERRFEADGPVRVRDLVFSPTWVNGGFVPPADLDVLRRSLLPGINRTESAPERIYVSRSKSPSRPLRNEREIEDALTEKGFAVVHLEEFSFPEQMALVRNAKTIVAPHGAGLANLVAVSPGTTVVEFLSRNWFNTCYAKLAVQLGCNYRFVESAVPAEPGPGSGIASPPISPEAVIAALAPTAR